MKRIKVLIPVIILTALIIILVILLNPSKRYEKLSIDEGKWESLQASRQASDDLQLEKIEFNDYSLIIDEGTDTIYYSIVKENQTKYNPNVSFEASDNHAKLVILKDEITDKKVHSDYQFKMMIYNSDEYHIYNLVCTDFPIVNINYDIYGIMPKEKNIDVEVTVFDNMEKSSKRITNSQGVLNILKEEGRKDYKLKLTTNSPGKNERENHLSIFQMDPHNEYLLTQEEELGQKNFKVELFINNEYQGQYSLQQGNKKNDIPGEQEKFAPAGRQ